jgi:hypothetical protein
MKQVFPTSRKQNLRGREILAFLSYYFQIKEHFNRPTTNIIFSAFDLLINFIYFKFLLTPETCRFSIFKIASRTEPSTIRRTESLYSTWSSNINLEYKTPMFNESTHTMHMQKQHMKLELWQYWNTAAFFLQLSIIHLHTLLIMSFAPLIFVNQIKQTAVHRSNDDSCASFNYLNTTQ